jgi:hypothetical protein
MPRGCAMERAPHPGHASGHKVIASRQSPALSRNWHQLEGTAVDSGAAEWSVLGGRSSRGVDASDSRLIAWFGAVDLKGFTQDPRPAILATRPAPIQVGYLGYPGTMCQFHRLCARRSDRLAVRPAAILSGEDRPRRWLFYTGRRQKWIARRADAPTWRPD